MAKPIWLSIPVAVGGEDLLKHNSYSRLKNLPSGRERDELVKEMTSLGELTPRSDGIRRLDRGFARGFVGMARGIGSTAEELGMGDALREWGDEILETNQQWNRPDDVGVFGYILDAAGSGAGNMAVLAPAMAADFCLVRAAH